ncbi:MAG: hypothetical protein ACLS43_07985 [Evtepia gabavorous]
MIVPPAPRATRSPPTASPSAYVQGEDTYQTAVRQVEDQVSEILRSDYRYAQEPPWP